MPGKKKKQHYVPQCYLEGWAIPDTHQVFVYDKQTCKERKSNILNVAEENCFYDIDLTTVIPESEKEKYGFSKDTDLSKADEEQFIENMLSSEIEGDFKNLLNEIKKFANKTPWEIQNCSFITDACKAEFSKHLAIQLLRVKGLRDDLLDFGNLLQQAFESENVSSDFWNNYTVEKSSLSFIQGKMLCDDVSINNIAQHFYSLKWVLLINKTTVPFFTSDNPIGTIPHVYDPYISTSGLASPGVEVYFPISPNIILTMYDGDYHVQFANCDRKSTYISDLGIIRIYNEEIARNCTRCVFSIDGDFSIIHSMIERNDNSLKTPTTVLEFGGKVYTLNKKSK